MALDPAILEVTELAYQAAVDPQLWPDVVRRTAGLFVADKSIVLDGVSGAMSTGFSDEAYELYFGRYQDLNPVQGAIRTQARASGAPPPSISTDQTWVDKRDYVASEFYNDFGRIHGVHGALMIGLGGPTLNVLRARGEGDFDGVELETARAVQGPLARAFALGRRLASEQRRDGGLGALLAHAAGALIVADGRGRVIYASPAAEAVLRASDGLTVRESELSAAHGATTGRLRAAIGRAVEAGVGSGISAARPSGRRPYAVLVAPARPTGSSERLALISIVDPEPQVHAAERLSELFGLTLGEARVAAHLTAGLDAREVAERLGVSFHTVRAQLARALAKTDTRRQAELVALIVRALGRLN